MLRSLTVVIGASITGLTSSLATASTRLSTFASSTATSAGIISTRIAGTARAFGTLAAGAENAAKYIGIGLSLPLALLGKTAVTTFGEMDGLRRGLATLEKDGASLQARLAKLDQIAKLPGLGFKETIAGDIRLRTVLNSIYGVDKAAKMSERTMLGFGNAVALVGKGKGEFDRALYGVQQLANTPFPLGEDLNILKDAIPQVTPLLNAAFGTARSEDFKKLGISSKQVLETILGGLEKLPKASGGVKNAIENLSDFGTKALDRIGGVINKNLNLSAISESITGFVDKLLTKFENLDPTIQKFILAFGAILVVFPPLIAAIGFFTTTVLPALKIGLATVRTSALLAGGPFTLIAVAVAAAAVLIIMHWDKIKKVLVDSGMWDQLKSLVKSALGIISSVFGIFANAFQGDWKNMGEHIMNLLKYFANAWISVTGGAVLAVGGLVAKGLSLVGLDNWSKAVETKMAEVAKTIESRKFKINAPTVDPFAGFNFAGEGGGKTGGKKTGGKKDKADTVEEETKLEELQRILKTVTDRIQDVGFGLERSKLGDLTTMAGNAAVAKNEAIIGSLQQQAEAIRTKIKIIEDLTSDARTDLPEVVRMTPTIDGNRKTPSFNAIPDRVVDTSNLNDTIKNATSVGDLNPAESGVARYFRGITESISGFKKPLEVASDEIKGVFSNLTSAVENTFTSAASSGAAAVGNFIGGLLSGTASISDFPRLILGVVADTLQSLATALAAAGAALLFVPGMQVQAAGQLAGAVGLFAAATLTRSLATPKSKSTAFATGGLVYGPTVGLVGEYAGASRNPEVIAPLDKLKGMLGNNGGGGVLTTRVSGGDLLIMLDHAKQSQDDFNGSY